MGHSSEHIIANYAPQLPAARWAPIRRLVRDTVRAYADTRTPESVRLALNYLTYFLDWVAITAMVPVSDALRVDIIDVYTRHRETEVSPVVAGRERKVLRTLAGLTNVRGARTTTTSPPEAPYTLAEQVLLAEWGRYQRSPQQAHNCMAILVLGIGCGLTVAEMVQVRGRDIVTLDDGGLGVVVLDGSRTVPVLDDWATELAQIKDATSDREFVIAPGAKTRTRVTTTAVITSSHGSIKPSPQRLRATWLVTHLDAGTPVNLLLDAAGLTAVDSLKRALPFARVPADAERTRLLRAVSSPVPGGVF